MKMIRKAVSMLTLAVMALAIGGSLTLALAGPVLTTKQIKWRDGIGQSSSTAPHDTTFLQDEVDTTRAVAVYTDDWDWGALGQATGGVATGTFVRLYFVATGSAIPEATDTIYFQVERGVPGVDAVTDSSFSISTTIASGAGAQAIAEGGTTGGRVWMGVLPIDPDTPGAANMWLVPKFRLRVCGDQSGSSPRVSGLKAFVVYPKRQESQ